MYVWRNIEARLRNRFCRGKAISIAHECVFVSLLIQHLKRMRRILFSFVACRVVLYFSTLCNKRHNFRKKNALYIFESNPHPFYSFRGLKNQMLIRFAVESWILEKW